MCVCVLDGTCPKGWLSQQDVVCVGTLCYMLQCLTFGHLLPSTCLLVCLIDSILSLYWIWLPSNQRIEFRLSLTHSIFISSQFFSACVSPLFF